MKKRNYYLLILLLYSCSNNKLITEVNQFIGQQIIMSQDWDVIWQGRDTVFTDVMEVPIKMVVWYDSVVCASCEVNKLFSWKEIIVSADSLAQWFSIIYLFTPKIKDLSFVKATLKSNLFDYPVFIDKNATFVKQNPKIPQNMQLHTFLLDKDNKVVVVGNPLHNPALWKLYKKIILKMIINDGVLPNNN